jgi:hypothetical protein
MYVIVGTQKVLFENGVLIDRQDYKDWTGAGTIRKCVADLRHDRAYNNYDYAYAVQTGTLRKKPPPPRKIKPRLLPEKPTVEPPPPMTVTPKPVPVLPAPVRATPTPVPALPTPVEAEVRYVRDEPRREPFSSALLMMLVMAVVGAGSAVMSAYHTTVFLTQGGKPPWTAVMTGVMLILFSGTAFTAARYFFTEGKTAAPVGVLFLTAGLAVIAYSVFCTLSVNYNQFKRQDDAAVSAAAAADEALAAHARLLAENQKELDELSHELMRLETDAEYWKERTWRRYDEHTAALTALRERRETARAERKALEAAAPRLAETAAASRETVYGFLAGLFGLPENAVRFFVFAVPACLYDVLAPFALTVVLLLADARRKRYAKVS